MLMIRFGRVNEQAFALKMNVGEIEVEEMTGMLR